MRLSPHFSLEELTTTSVGLPNEPDTAQVRCCLRALCSAVLEPLRAAWGGRPVRVSSGYRSPAVNEELRRLGYTASSTSQHLRGEAADVIPPGRPVDAFLVALELAEAGVPIDQVIVYEAMPHLHVSHTARYLPRREGLVKLARADARGRLYVPWAEYSGPLR